METKCLNAGIICWLAIWHASDASPFVIAALMVLFAFDLTDTLLSMITKRWRKENAELLKAMLEKEKYMFEKENDIRTMIITPK